MIQWICRHVKFGVVFEWKTHKQALARRFRFSVFRAGRRATAQTDVFVLFVACLCVLRRRRSRIGALAKKRPGDCFNPSDFVCLLSDVFVVDFLNSVCTHMVALFSLPRADPTIQPPTHHTRQTRPTGTGTRMHSATIPPPPPAPVPCAAARFSAAPGASPAAHR